MKFRTWCRHVVLLALAACSLWSAGVGALGNGGYPSKPVKIVVPFAPGAGTDAMARLVAQKLGDVLGGSFIVENRAGASGAIGTQYVAQQPADGYTLLLVASPFTTVAASLPTAGYDPLKNFAPVGMIASGPLVWVSYPKAGFRSMQDVVTRARQQPGAMNYGSAGVGGINHLVLELLKARTGIFITHIPYRGVSLAALDVVSGQVQLATGTIPALLPLIQEGRVTALAVTSAKRSSALPQVPSMLEAGFKGFDVMNYFALAAPAGTPATVVAKLNTALNKVLAQPDVLARFKLDAVDAAPGTPAALGQFLQVDFQAWRDVVRTQNLHLE